MFILNPYRHTAAGGSYTTEYSFDADGSNEHLRDTASSLSLTSNNFSGSAWIYCDTVTADHVIMSCGSAGNNPGWALLVDSGGTLKLQMRDSTGTNWKQGTKSGISAGTWYHVMFTFDESSTTGINVYIDNSVGTAGNPTGQDGDYTSTEDGAVGARYFSGTAGKFFDGHIAEPVIDFSNTWGSSDRAEAYNGGAACFDWANDFTLGNPTHHWPFNHISDDFTGGTGQVNDTGTGGLTLTPNNTESGDQDSGNLPAC